MTTTRFTVDEKNVGIVDNTTGKIYPLLSNKTAYYMAWQANGNSKVADPASIIEILEEGSITYDELRQWEAANPREVSDVVYDLMLSIGGIEPDYLATLKDTDNPKSDGFPLAT